MGGVCHRVGTQDGYFRIGHSFGVEEGESGGPAIKAGGLLADIPLPTPAIDLPHHAHETNFPTTDRRSRRDDLRAFDALVAIDPEIEQAAGGFVLWWGGHPSESSSGLNHDSPSRKNPAVR